jgi:beta-lactamase superfamily II metal-dependent hydrolase
MSNNVELAQNIKKPEALAIIVLNVGDGDAIIIRYPPKHDKQLKKIVSVIDCYNAGKTIAVLKKLKPDKIAFICATHPHYDHTKGLSELINWCINQQIEIEEFWDTGFRHVSKTHYDLIQLLRNNPQIKVNRPTSGFESVINKVRVLVLNPSMYLRNRYDTFGTNINNASIVLKLEYPPVDIAPFYLKSDDFSDDDLEKVQEIGQNTIILGGDAQFDAWARITQEFPELMHTDNRGQLIETSKKTTKPLRCQILKVPHHMSKHSISLETLEYLLPKYTIASCKKNSNHGFPHELTVMAIEEIHKKNLKKIKNKEILFTGHPTNSSGTIVTLLFGGHKRPKIYKLGESIAQNAPIP